MYRENLNFSKKGINITDKHGNPLTKKQVVGKAVNRSFNWWLDFKLFLIHIVSLHIPIYPIRRAIFVLSGVKIGKGSTVHMGCKYFEPSGVSIGEDTIIGDRAFLDGRAKLKIGDHVDIASEVMIYNSEHDIESETFSANSEPVNIGDFVFIGPRSIILPGVDVGKGAVIAAGSVVTKSVDKFSIVAGVPARKIGERKNKTLNYRLGRARLFQ